MGVTPLQDFAIGSTFQDARAQFVVVDVQELRQTGVRSASHIFMIIMVQLSLSMEPNLIQHSGEVA